MLTTPGGNANLQSVITSLFGGRANNNATIPIITNATPDEKILSDYNLPVEDEKKLEATYASIGISGFVSSAETGAGRFNTDQQFVFVNGRPVDYNKVRPACFRSKSVCARARWQFSDVQNGK